MKYLRLLNSHSDYESAEFDEEPVVVFDGEHVHYGEYSELTDTTDIIED